MKACERCGAFGPNLKFFDLFAGGVENEDANFLDLVRSCGDCRPSRFKAKYVKRRVVAAYTDGAIDSYWTRTLCTVLLSCGHAFSFNSVDQAVGTLLPCGRCTNAR